jgi:anti-sigma regulatory factor (Ser/Thr protein kinase)
MSTSTVVGVIPQDPFRHEAMLYGSQAEFVDGTLDFISEGLAADEPMLVVLAAPKIDLLKERLGNQAGRVRFADMAKVGANPARIIPAWREFADESSARGGPFRGIGEPIWAGRSPDELVECQRHEALLNLAFADTTAFRLLCPYDTESLDAGVLEEAHRSHPSIVEAARERESGIYRDLDEVAAPFDWPLPEPTHVLVQLAVEPGNLARARRAVVTFATEAGLGRAKVEDLVLAVNEVATNALVHGGGWGRLRLWRQAPALVCEVRDGGRIDDPLVGRLPPPNGEEGGRGLWLASHLCDLVQVRTFASGSVVRLHMRPE